MNLYLIVDVCKEEAKRVDLPQLTNLSLDLEYSQEQSPKMEVVINYSEISSKAMDYFTAKCNQCSHLELKELEDNSYEYSEEYSD